LHCGRPYFLAVDVHVWGRFDPELDASAVDPQDGDEDVITDPNALSRLAAKD